MSKLVLSDLANLQNESSVISTLNNNNTAVETALENTLSRDGTSPNTMSADLDINGNQILNLPDPVDPTDVVRLQDLEDALDNFVVPPGPKGDPGEQGEPGPANTLTIGTVTAGTAGASITGTAPNQVLNLVLQTGPSGADGTDGNDGAPGPSINVYVQTSAPSTSGVPEGSLWIDSDDNSKLYKLTSGSWVDQGVNLKGADGVGTGDASTNTATSVDSEIVLFSGTGGKTLKRATSTGILKATSGVIGTGTAGTDYLAPPSGTSILKANSGGALANATAGTDYLAPPSGTSILKANSGGALANASAGTDYVAPGGALGTPSSGTLTNCTGLPVAGITASTSTAIGVGSIELGHASDTSLTRSGAGTLAVEGVDVALNSTSKVHTASTIELGNVSDTTLSRSSAGVLAVEGVTVSLNSTSATHTAGTIELGAASDTTLSRSAAGELAVEGTVVKKVGKETIWIPAVAMYPTTTNGAATGSAEMSTNKNMFKTLDFDTSTQEFAQFEVFFPKSWNTSTVTFKPVWSHASTTTNFGVVWALQGVARSDDDAGDVAFGTEQTSIDTGGTTNDIYIGPESSAITIGGSPTTGDTVQFQVKRVPANGSDTMTIDARLHGVQLFFTTSASTDA